MLPWEHLLFGYVSYSVLSRVAWSRPPSDKSALAVALATQMPDLVDKPLSWTLGIIMTGYGPAHSVFVGLPGMMLVAGAARTRDRLVAIAALVGYVSHLVTDVLALRANGPNFGRLLWPLAPQVPYESNISFIERFGTYVGIFLFQMMHPENLVLVLGYVAILSLGAVLWVLDGTPGIRWLRHRIGSDH